MKNQTSVDSLQATINKQAEIRLRKDLWALSNSIKKNRLVIKNSGNKVPELMVVNPKADLQEVKAMAIDGTDVIGSSFKAISHKQIDVKDLPDVLYMYTDVVSMDGEGVSPYIRELFYYWLPFYIEEETKAFIDRIDKIQEDVDYLNGSVANLECNQH